MKRVESLKSSSISGNPSVFPIQKGKIPPQAVDLEEVVLGAMMIDKKGVDEVIDILQPDAFYKESHKTIFNSIINLFDKQEPIDIKTVSHQLKREGKLNLVGGDYYLVELTQKVSLQHTSNFTLELYYRNLYKEDSFRSRTKLSKTHMMKHLMFLTC